MPTGAFAQDAEADAADSDVTSEGDTIVVQGFRDSLSAAIQTKRNANNQVDVIVAEDIAKFPDTNLAESLQRVPGIAIQRDAGEGRTVVVRGLGGQFTRVRVNGMETIATSPDNNGRGFDFNIFASELFNSIVVNKTAEAGLDEGSLGAVIDLNTGNPLSLDTGLTFVASAQVRYNDLNDDAGPRASALLGWVNPEGTFGASVSAAYSEYVTPQLGNNTVRWTQGAFRSVKGTACFNGNTYVPSPACNEVGLAFHPRIPRYGLIEHERERLGLTGAIQWQPSESTKLSIDGLFATFDETRNELWGEVLFRSNERGIDVVDYTIDANNNLISGTFNNAWVRTENFRRELNTEFYQISARLEQKLTERLNFTVLVGASKSDADSPIETTIIFDDRDFNGFSYDYTDMFSPQITFGANGISNPAQFQLAEFRDRPNNVTNEYETISGNIQWEAFDGITFEAGGLYRKFTFDTVQLQRDSTYCAAFACAPGQIGLQVTPEISEIFNLGNAGQPAGTTSSWLIPNLEAAAGAINLYGRTATPNLGADRTVTEEVTGGYVQVDWNTDVAGMKVTGNAGLRYVRTDQLSTGFIGSTEVGVTRDYDDWLPAVNLNAFITDDLVLRGAWSKVITRPGLGNLTPGGNIDQFNFRITSGNPFLSPFRADAFDAALEWYFAPGAIASVAFFAKDIKSFPIASSFNGTYADSQLPTSLLTAGTPLHTAIVGGQNPDVPIEFRTNIDGEGGNLKGVEFQLNLPFSVFTEGFFSRFGVLGNVTLIESDVEYTLTGPAPALNGSGNPSGGAPEIFTRPLFDLAKKSANATIYYEDAKFSARASVAYRDDYIDGVSGTRNLFEGFGSSLNLDATLRYRINDKVELALEGTNLTDNYRERWVHDPARRNYENNHFGRVILVGARFAY
ncbi:MAG: TonB-dependent receptor [Erythrobacter sp.]|nr:TonB-dependent receptor [Erythrobacter sp.]MCL9998873.1 TonB-dependent receptor [Erythrobacter sp.]